MIRVFLVTVLFLSMVFGRENPFEPVVSPDAGFSPKEASQIESTFTKETLELPSSARVLQKVTVEFQNIDGSVDTMSKNINKEIDWHYPVLITQTTKENIKETPKVTKQNKSYDTGLKFISFEIDNNVLMIKTKDKLLRDFSITEPPKIVIDLAGNKNFQTKLIDTDASIFKEVAIGKHRDFYRVAIELDGIYKYSLRHTDYGLEVKAE
ncbi:MAG: AMIN domain-containing protein [Campylobacterales bacterium]